MRAFEIIVAVIFALAAFMVVKIAGVVIKIALAAGLIGLLAGFVMARLFRRR